MTSHEYLFQYILLAFLCLHGEVSGQQKPKEVVGILGGSVTFHFGVLRPFHQILWFKNEDHVATLTAANPCQLQVFKDYTTNLLQVFENCTVLTIRDLHKEDSSTYKAQILRLHESLEVKTFRLHVYKSLSEHDVQIVCTKAGNETVHLNCSASDVGEGVEYEWGPASRHEASSSENTLVLPHNSQDDDLNITCTARNPVSNTSRIVSLRRACDGGGGESPTMTPGTVAAKDNETTPHQLSGPMKAGIAIAVTAAIVAIAVYCYLRRKKKRGPHVNNKGSAGHPEPKDCTTVYALVGNVPEDTSTQKTKPRREHTKANKDLSQTVYTAVHHPNLNPLQTDDEKMQKEGQGGAMKDSDKTVYSEIRLEENEDQHIKTVYETVNHPKLPKAQEYNDII